MALLAAMQGKDKTEGRYRCDALLKHPRFKEWQEKHGRYVPKGTKCHIFIFAPCKRKREVKKKDDKGNYILDKNGDPVTEIKEWIDFKSTPVYDVSQTVGDPIASVSSLFSGRIDGYPEVIRIVSEASPSIVRFNDADTGYDKVNDCINIGSCLSQRDTLQALLPSVAAATMYKQSGQWMLYADYARKGYAKSRTHMHYDAEGDLHTRTYLVWTEKGRRFIHRICSDEEIMIPFMFSVTITD